MRLFHARPIAAALLVLTFSFGSGSVVWAHDHQEHGAASAGDVIKSAKSGTWSSTETWKGGKVPAAGAKVLIQKGHEVVYDVSSDAVIRGIQVSGVLKFAADRDTRLDVGLIRIEAIDDYSELGFDCAHFDDAAPNAKGPGPADNNPAPAVTRAALEIGLPNAPLPSEHKALIRLHYIEGMDKESCPAILCCGGRMDIHGAPMERTWVKLPYQTAKVGEARLVMPANLPGWKKGDKIIISGTTRQFGYIGTRYRKEGKQNSVADNPTTEERTIIDIGGKWGNFDSNLQIVRLDKPLEFDHLGVGEFRAEVANLSRNVVIESADPEGVRGHTMYHADSAGGMSYAEFRHLGKKDTLGKYPIHYHLVGDTMRGSSLIGLSVWDSHNRWITVHGTQYLVVKDCIGYRSVGHGFFLEDGTEVYNIFDRNLAVQALGGKPLPKQVLPYDGNLGSGYWWANSLNTFTNNVAAECDEDGFRYEAVDREDFSTKLTVLQKDGEMKDVDIRTLPFVRFDGNEAHCQRLFALNLGGFPGGNSGKDKDVEGIGPDVHHPFLIRNMKIWNSHWAFHGGTPSVQLQDVQIHDCAYGLWRSVMDGHEHLRLNFSQVNTTVFYPRSIGVPQEEDGSYGGYSFLKPVDDHPPITVITHVEPTSSGLLQVRGVTTDNYDVKRVVVNGEPVRATAENFAEWEVTLPAASAGGGVRLVAHGEDAEGNVEKLAHRRDFYPAGASAQTSVEKKLVKHEH
jgi:hypothetical protein